MIMSKTKYIGLLVVLIGFMGAVNGADARTAPCGQFDPIAGYYGDCDGQGNAINTGNTGGNTAGNTGFNNSYNNNGWFGDTGYNNQGGWNNTSNNSWGNNGFGNNNWNQPQSYDFYTTMDPNRAIQAIVNTTPRNQAGYWDIQVDEYFDEYYEEWDDYSYDEDYYDYEDGGYYDDCYDYYCDDYGYGSGGGNDWLGMLFDIFSMF